MAVGKKRSLTGIRPSGNVHLGNYLGMIRPALERQKDYECLYFLADMHALTTLKNKQLLRQYTLDCVATWLALGFDYKHNLLYRQSDVPMVAELTWYLSCCTGMGLLEKAHAYKDALAQNKDINHGFFNYPVLMAADIVLYDSDIVPVGKDQKQHVEMARDMAGSFNALFGGEILKLPEPQIEETVMSIPGLDGRKMSKSYGNEIPLFANEKDLKKLILSIKTDSTPLEEPKSLKGTLLGDMFSFFSTPEQMADLEARMNRGGMGWGHAKVEFFEILNSQLREPRSKYDELRKDEKALISVLEDGATRAHQIGLKVLNRVRDAIGYMPFPYSR